MALEQVLGEVRAGADAALGERRAAGREVGVEVEGARRRAAVDPGGGDLAVGGGRDGAVQRTAAGDRSRTSSGSARTCAATACIGAASADQTAPATPAAAARASSPSGPSAIRAKPIRQPPRAMFLLSPFVTKLRSGTTSAGPRNAAGSNARSR